MAMILQQLLQVSKINLMECKEKIIGEWTSRKLIRLLWDFHWPIIFIIKKYIDLIDKDDVKTQWRSIYDAIDDLFTEKVDYFTDEFLQHCKWNPNILQFLPRENDNIIKEISLEGRLYSQAVMIRHPIMKIKVTHWASVKDN